MQQSKPGYIVILAVMIIAAMTALVTSVVNRMMVYTKLQYVLADREQARMLALSGLQIAIAQLISDAPTTFTTEMPLSRQQEPALRASGQGNPGGQQLDRGADAQKKTAEDKSPAAQFKKVLPIINRWQQFAFTEDQGGIAGSCEIYIAAEQGKINLNALYDFKKKQFVKPDPAVAYPGLPPRQAMADKPGQQSQSQGSKSGASQAVDGLKILQAVGDLFPIKGQIFAEAVGDVFKARGRPLVDVTELLSDKKFQKLKDMLFIAPEKERSAQDSKKERAALLDLFTVETNAEQKNGLQPLVISRSVGLMLQLKAINNVDKKMFDKLVESLKNLKIPVQWQQQWDQLLSPVYGKQYNVLSNDIKQLFATEFETLTFSVVCYGKFRNTLIKVYAVLARQEEEYCIKKLYWL